MEISTKPAITQVPGSVIEPTFGRGTSGKTLHDSGTIPDAVLDCEAAQRRAKDPHGLSDSASLAFAAYTVAVECHRKLLSRVLDEEAVLHRLRKLAPGSAFQIDYVARQAFKLINPRGHGANSPRFCNETLGWFRQTYPEDSHLTAGFIMLLCATKWWTHEQGHRAIVPRMNPLTTSDLDRKLKAFGFLSGERQAICRMLRRSRI